MKHSEFYIEGDNLINRAFELINNSVITESTRGNFYSFSADIISIENPSVREDRDIINVLIHHALIESLGFREIDNHSDCQELFMLTVLANRFRDNKSKFKGWIIQSEIERRENADRKRIERQEPIKIGVRGAIYAAVIGALCGFALSQLNLDKAECNVSQLQCDSVSAPQREISNEMGINNPDPATQ